MSGPAAFSGLNEAPWIRSNNLNRLPPLANLNAEASSTVSSHMLIPRAHAFFNTSQDSIETDQSRDSSRPKRKRPLYSHNRCFQCRERRIKCGPENRQWPGEKCDACEKGGLPCSPVQSLQEYKRQKTKSSSPQYTAPDKCPVTPPEQLLKDCWVALGWCQMLDHIICVARNIDASLQRFARRCSSGAEGLLNNLFSTRLTVYKLLDRQIGEIWAKKDSIDNADLLRLFRAIMLARLELGLPNSFSDIPYTFTKHLTSALHTSPESIGQKASVHEVYMAEIDLYWTKGWDGVGGRAEITKKYVGELHAIWCSISDLHDRYDLPATTRSSFLKPFIHEFYFQESALPSRILSWRYVKHIGMNCGHFKTDSLGRTALHFAASLLSPLGLDPDGWIMFFLNNEESIDATDNFGRTPLHVACAGNSRGSPAVQLKIIEALLVSNAKINIQDKYGLMAIEYAVLSNRTDILEVFQQFTRLDISKIISEMTDAEATVRNTCDVVKGKITGISGPSLDAGESDSDTEESSGSIDD
ncbi:hypothetical protein F4859DRAFT_286059 [Xylaria cf. heliscus]|nr:hypothetical protein F4859DRAFT_286059 [Xylaria cf. heliscus]